MSRRLAHLLRVLSLAVAGALLCATVRAGAQAPTQKGRTGLDLATVLGKWTGDLDGMQERRTIRVLTAYNRTLYFIDKGTERGTAADQGRLLETELNKTMAKGHLNVRVIFVPVSRDELLPALLDGRGDIVMGHITMTPEREKLVDFADPWITNVDEIVVTGPNGLPSPRSTTFPARRCSFASRAATTRACRHSTRNWPSGD